MNLIKIFETVIEQKRFPDKTLLIQYRVFYKADANITWVFEDDSELWTLIALTRHVQQHGIGVSLYMPYIPNGRQDRVKEDGDVFTLKYFCDVINGLGFKTVTVRDAHSNVSLALLNNVIQEPVEPFIETAINESKPHLLFYPDEGSQKRYSEKIKMPSIFGIKKRAWKTGDIIGLDVFGEVPNEPFDVLIVDDICSKGGTFFQSANKLKELGARNIDLYVTHCENSILEGEFTEKKITLLETGLIRNVFTTQSVFTLSHPQIKIIGGTCNE